MNNQDFIPAKLRANVYAVFAFLGLALGAIQVGFSAADLGQPVWLTVALAVYDFIGTGIGYTALTHTATPPTSLEIPQAYKADYDDDDINQTQSIDTSTYDQRYPDDPTGALTDSE